MALSDAGKDFKEMRDMTAHLKHVEAREYQRSTCLNNRTGIFLAFNLEKKIKMINFVERFREI